jgi:hypothetical protein
MILIIFGGAFTPLKYSLLYEDVQKHTQSYMNIIKLFKGVMVADTVVIINWIFVLHLKELNFSCTS